MRMKSIHETRYRAPCIGGRRRLRVRGSIVEHLGSSRMQLKNIVKVDDNAVIIENGMHTMIKTRHIQEERDRQVLSD